MFHGSLVMDNGSATHHEALMFHSPWVRADGKDEERGAGKSHGPCFMGHETVNKSHEP